MTKGRKREQVPHLRDPIRAHLRRLKRLAITYETLLRAALQVEVLPVCILPRTVRFPIEPREALEELITLANRPLPEEENLPSPLSVNALSPPSDSDWER